MPGPQKKQQSIGYYKCIEWCPDCKKYQHLKRVRNS